MLQSSCTGSTSPLTTWRMRRLNLQGQVQCVVAFSVDLKVSPFHRLFRACLFPCQAQGQQGAAAVGTRHTHLPRAAFLAHFSPLFWGLTPCVGSPKHLGEKMMPSNLPAGARRISGLPAGWCKTQDLELLLQTQEHLPQSYSYGALSQGHDPVPGQGSRVPSQDACELRPSNRISSTNSPYSS